MARDTPASLYHDVGVKKPNAFGLYDMHGGVWEWCADRYDPDYYFTSPLVDPRGPEKGPFRVLRGGSWFRYSKYARSSYRKFFHPDGDGDATTGLCYAINHRGTETTEKGKMGKKYPASVFPVFSSLCPLWLCGSIALQSPTTAYITDFGCRLVVNLSDLPAKAGQDKAALALAENLVKHKGNPVLDIGKPGAWDDKDAVYSVVYKSC